MPTAPLDSSSAYVEVEQQRLHVGNRNCLKQASAATHVVLPTELNKEQRRGDTHRPRRLHVQHVQPSL
eukprot:CAMPEP_0178982454 /NCGR_PEP_ID=MMETSP0795-20121207/505_1 /TAXON_ID=88552 /ORGANISM="Amoebophrya sp., Strain Ameob2" /LENGTH=67 /DNA_ID=CAMNT_0020673101 /DNA_START=683 /DNA_END=886 /DNA_ORIENTATION=-